jgi:bacteriorhodopsin
VSETQETWLWIGFAGMTLGAVVIAALGRRAREEDRHHFVASCFVCLLAAVAYFAMAVGQGIVQVDDRSVYAARYADWLLTTPLLLLGLLMIGLPILGGRGDTRSRTALVAGVIGADALMILTGLFAALSADETVRYTWYAISCGAFLAVLWLLFGPVRAEARAAGGGTFALYDRLTKTLTALWFVYPVLWLLGTEGTGTISLGAEIAVFAVVDLAAKVGFGLLLVTGVLKLARETRVERIERRPTEAVAA